MAGTERQRGVDGERFDASTWQHYRGRWVAVKDGVVAGAAPSLAALYEQLAHEPHEYDLVTQVPESLYDFASWERVAREQHAELRRRRRG